MSKEIKVVELFAGVGGFRVGLERASQAYKVVWSNQWEPATKKQYASEIYTARFGHKGHSNKDIAKVPVSDIPDHDILVGGFPCQDYSVARTLNQAEGLVGKKGVLWWEIHRIISEKKKKPKVLFLENVDRLIKSPAKQRGRDLAIMLASLSDLGYIVEWRIINAADYGMPQRRRRIFLLGYHRTSKIGKEILKLNQPREWILGQGVLAQTFETVPDKNKAELAFKIKGDLADISGNFNKAKPTISPFENTGLIIDRIVHTIPTIPNYDGPRTVLGDIILKNGAVPKDYYIEENSLDKWMYLKGAKTIERVNKDNGIAYQYSEGSMVFPDPLDKPSRTIITGEGGATPSRFKHVIMTAERKLRRLTPLELEKLNMFPENHTEGATDVKRAFFMGNALVVGIIEKIGQTIAKYF